MYETDLAVVVPQVAPMDGLGAGAQAINASIGFMLLITGFFLTHSAVTEKKKTIFPYTLDESLVVARADAKPEIHKLLAVLSFLLFGWAGSTLLLSGPGLLADAAKWLQELVASLGENQVLADAGAPGICLFLFFAALSSKTNYRADYLFGTLAGVIFPLGGGVWLEASRGVGQLGVALYEGLEKLATWVADFSPLAIVGFILACLAASWVWRTHLSKRVQEKVASR